MSFKHFFSEYDSNIKTIYNNFIKEDESELKNPFKSFDLNSSQLDYKAEEFLTQKDNKFTNFSNDSDTWAVIGDILPRAISKSSNKSQSTKHTSKGRSEFESNLEKALKINPSISKYKDFLIATASRESGFNSYIQNTAGAPYYGYFQMGKEEIKSTTGLSVEEFRNDPVSQILGAAKLYEKYINSVKKLGVYELCKEKGYSDDAIAAGAWLGGPGGVKKFITEQGDPSDSHWYNGKGGTTVGTLMNQFKNNG